MDLIKTKQATNRGLWFFFLLLLVGDFYRNRSEYITLCLGSVTPQEPPAVTYRQLRERGFKGTKYDAELMIAQGFTLAAATHQQHTVAPFLGKLKVGQFNY